MKLTTATTFALLVTVMAAGCVSHQSGVNNTPSGSQSVYVDPGSATQKGPVGVGFESQDLISMTDRIARDMLANLADATAATPRRVILDAEYFRNEGTSRLNKNAITDRLRVALNRSAAGRLVFVGREYAGMVENERTLKREGVVDQGAAGLKTAPAGADYRLGGRITTLDSVDPKSGLASRYHQITFEMIDLEKGTIVWSDIYEFRKVAQDDIIYQ